MELHNRIKTFRVNNSLTQQQLADRIKVSVISVRNWESGQKAPSIASIIALANALNVTTDSLLGVSQGSHSMEYAASTSDEKKLLCDYRELDFYGKRAVNAVCSVELLRVEKERDAEKKVIRYQKPGRYIPLYLSPSAAGFSAPLDNEQFELIPADNQVPANADFAVRIQGNSMSPYINDGDIVYAEKTTELSIGDVGIFCVNGSMYCKQYYIDDDGNLTLVSANEALRHSNVYVSADSCESVECLGKVIMSEKICLPEYMEA